MKIYAILVHDKKDSLNAFIYNKIITHLRNKNNIEIDAINLYDYADQFTFFYHDKAKMEANPFFQLNKKKFMESDRLVIVHPIYWYSLPGILKCWIDLITNYAYKYESGKHARASHKIKKSMVVNTSLAPAFYRKYFTHNTATNQMKENFRFFDIPEFYFYQIGGVYQLNPTKVEAHIQKILKLTDKLIS